jgi:hypothetical protein
LKDKEEGSPPLDNDSENTLRGKTDVDGDALYASYLESKARYYRNVLRKQDNELLKKILKIPDNWDGYEKNENSLVISHDEKKRLSDIKKAKSLELKFEGIFAYHLVRVEDTLMSCLNYRSIPQEQLEEAKHSADNLLPEIKHHIPDFKHLLLRLAKRSVSDFYYLMISYVKFYKKRNFNFKTDFTEFLSDSIRIFIEYEMLPEMLGEFISYSNSVDRFFSKSSNVIGWRLNEFELKDFLENQTDVFYTSNNLKRIANSAFSFTKKLKQDHNFITYYYNHNDGKLFRYNFIVNSLSQKLKENLITTEMFEGLNEIRHNFILIKQHFERDGIEWFGPEKMNYYKILEFLYKCCKIIEFFYLRSMEYDKLQELRNEILLPVEKELRQLDKLIGKYQQS